MGRRKANPRKHAGPRKVEPAGRTGRLSLIVMVAAVMIAALVYRIFFYTSNGTPGATTPSKRATTDSGSPEFKKQGELTFLSSDERALAMIDIEIANDDLERAVGLMHRDELGERRGMLFIFAREEPRSFWMRNTHIPLDIIFVNARKEIVSIHKNAIPYSQEEFHSGAPSLYVVEVDSGFVDRHSIKPGGRISW
ncbi:MAG: DUF192 domain-containing protein [Candidatus Zixiibacteriota bacterium]|nr:MAG: DUF192 domain-containing protein [candidate division Zixibacteria bacterium]